MTVYFAQPKGMPVDPIKIGFTGGLDRRIVELERQYGCEMNLLASCNGGRRLERALHEVFSPYRVHGEWFEPVDDLFRLIDDIRVNGSGALPTVREDQPAEESIRVNLLKDEASELVRSLGGYKGTAKEQVLLAAAKTGLSPTQVERLRYKKIDRIYADVMDAIRTAMASEMDAITSADLFALKRHIAGLKLTTPTNRIVRASVSLGRAADLQGGE